MHMKRYLTELEISSLPGFAENDVNHSVIGILSFAS